MGTNRRDVAGSGGIASSRRLLVGVLAGVLVLPLAAAAVVVAVVAGTGASTPAPAPLAVDAVLSSRVASGGAAAAWAREAGEPDALDAMPAGMRWMLAAVPGSAAEAAASAELALAYDPTPDPEPVVAATPSTPSAQPTPAPQTAASAPASTVTPAPRPVATPSSEASEASEAETLGASAGGSSPAAAQEPAEAPRAAASEPQPVSAPAGAGLNERETLFLANLNAARRAHGLPALTLDSTLTSIARQRSHDMVSNGYFAHVSPTGQSWLTLVQAAGLRVSAGGENLARVGGDVERSVSVASEKLMESPTHRENILGRHYGRVGVGAVTSADGVTVFTTIFTN